MKKKLCAIVILCCTIFYLKPANKQNLQLIINKPQSPLQQQPTKKIVSLKKLTQVLESIDYEELKKDLAQQTTAALHDAQKQINTEKATKVINELDYLKQLLDNFKMNQQKLSHKMLCDEHDVIEYITAGKINHVQSCLVYRNNTFTAAANITFADKIINWIHQHYAEDNEKKNEFKIPLSQATSDCREFLNTFRLENLSLEPTIHHKSQIKIPQTPL